MIVIGGEDNIDVVDNEDFLVVVDAVVDVGVDETKGKRELKNTRIRKSIPFPFSNGNISRGNLFFASNFFHKKLLGFGKLRLQHTVQFP